MEPDTDLEAIIDPDLKTGKFVIVTIPQTTTDAMIVKCKSVLVAKHYPQYEYHSDIVDWYRQVAKVIGIRIAGGGILEVDPTARVVRTFGQSGSYGVANLPLVQRILERQYEGYALDIASTSEIW